MGAVRVHVRLTNAADEVLVRTGQLQKLGLPPIESKRVQYADGRTEVVDMTGPINVRIFDRRSNEDACVLGDEILIGQTALESMDLHVDCLNQRLIPNPKHPDEPVLRV